MKQLLTLMLFFTLVSCKPKELPTQFVNNPSEVIVKLSHMTTKGELAKMYHQIKEQHNIDMNYTKSAFFDDGKLRSLKLQVTLPDGKKAQTSADLMTIQYKYYGMHWLNGGGFKIGHMGNN